MRLRGEALKDPLRAPAARRDLFEGLASLSVFDVAPYADEISEKLGLFPARAESAHRRAEKGGKPAGAPRRSLAAGMRRNSRKFQTMRKFTATTLNIWYAACSGATRENALLVPSRQHRAVYVGRVRSRDYIRDDVGDEPEALERRWQQMNDEKGMRIIARGNGLLARALSQSHAGDGGQID